MYADFHFDHSNFTSNDCTANPYLVAGIPNKVCLPGFGDNQIDGFSTKADYPYLNHYASYDCTGPFLNSSKRMDSCILSDDEQSAKALLMNSTSRLPCKKEINFRIDHVFIFLYFIHCRNIVAMDTSSDSPTVAPTWQPLPPLPLAAATGWASLVYFADNSCKIPIPMVQGVLVGVCVPGLFGDGNENDDDYSYGSFSSSAEASIDGDDDFGDDDYGSYQPYSMKAVLKNGKSLCFIARSNLSLMYHHI